MVEYTSKVFACSLPCVSFIPIISFVRGWTVLKDGAKIKLSGLNIIQNSAYFSGETIRDGCHARKLVHGVEAEKAIVLVHGLSDSPYFLSAVGEFFHFELGYDVYLPLLYGHGLKNPDGVQKASLEEWKKNVRFASLYCSGQWQVSLYRWTVNGRNSQPLYGMH